MTDKSIEPCKLSSPSEANLPVLEAKRSASGSDKPGATSNEGTESDPPSDRVRLVDQRAASAQPPDAERQLIANGLLPPLIVDGTATQQQTAAKDCATASSDAVVRPRDATESAIMHLFQTRLMTPAVLAQITTPDQRTAGETDAQARQLFGAKLAARESALKEEMNPQPPSKPYWGRASQQAMHDYLAWVETRAVPAAVANLVSAGILEPPGNPIRLPPQMSREDFETSVVTGRITADLGLDYRQIPDLAGTVKLENALRWSIQANGAVREQQADLLDRKIEASIDEMGFPKGWHYKEGEDRQAWRKSVAAMTDLYGRIGRAISVIDSQNMPVDLPPGAQVTRGSGGNITHMVLAMPDDLRPDDPRNLEIVEQSRRWLQFADERIKNALSDKAFPPLEFSEHIIPPVSDGKGGTVSAQARLDEQGHLIDLINPSMLKPDQRQTAQDVNLLSERFSVTRYPDAKDYPDGLDVSTREARLTINTPLTLQSDKGPVTLAADWPLPVGARFDKSRGRLIFADPDQAITLPGGQIIKSQDVPAGSVTGGTHLAPNEGILVDQQVQAQSVPFYSPQNLIYTNIGQPMKLSQRIFVQDDLVTVRNGGSTEYVLAKDLPSLHNAQELYLYGSKAIALGMDAAMLATGSVEIAAALDGAMILASGEVAAMSGAKLALLAGKGALDISLATSDPLGNAYWQSQENGRNASQVRSYLFLGSMIGGLGSQAIAAFDSDIAASQALEAQQMGVLMAQTGGAVETTGATASKVMYGLSIPMLASMAGQVATKWENLDRPPVDAAVARQATNKYNGAGQQAPGDALVSKPVGQNQDQIASALAEYRSAMLPHTTDPFSRPAVTALFDTASKTLDHGTEEEKLAFQRTLMQNVLFDGDQLAVLNSRNLAKLSSAELNDLLDPEKRSHFPNKAVADYASEILESRDPDVTLASKMLLLALARDSQGQLQPLAATDTVQVSPYVVRSSGASAGQAGSAEASATDSEKVYDDHEHIAIETAALVSGLQRELLDRNLGLLAPAIGDLLVKSGGLRGRQYGALLQDALEDPSIDSAGKMRLLLNNRRLLVDDDCKNVLSAALVQATDPDMKAMVALLLFAARRTQVSAIEGSAILDNLSTIYQAWQNNESGRGVFARLAIEALRHQLAATETSNVQARLDAAEVLSLTSRGSPSPDKTVIDGEIAAALGQSFQAASPQQKSAILDTLVPNLLPQLHTNYPALTNSMALQMIGMLAHRDYQQEKRSDDALTARILQALPAMIRISSPNIKTAFLDQCQTLLAATDDVLAPVAAPNSPLKIATLQALGQVGAPWLIPLLHQLAGYSSAPAVRASALQALDQMDDRSLADLVNSRRLLEQDVAVASLLDDLKAKLAPHFGREPVPSEDEQFADNVGERYPELRQFDGIAQNAWLAANFPLLIHQNFERQVVAAGKDVTGWLFTSQQMALDEVEGKIVEQRQDQFSQLVALAQSNPASATAAGQRLLIEQARVVLASIAGSGGKMVGQDSNKPIQIRSAVNFGRVRSSSVIYNEVADDWAEQAAMAMIELASSGNSDRDLSVKLLQDALSSQPPIAVRAKLLQALQESNATGTQLATLQSSATGNL